VCDCERVWLKKAQHCLVNSFCKTGTFMLNVGLYNLTKSAPFKVLDIFVSVFHAAFSTNIIPIFKADNFGYMSASLTLNLAFSSRVVRGVFDSMVLRWLMKPCT
jgi:hypothetical protein